MAHVPGLDNELADALSRSPAALPSSDIEILNINDFDSSPSTPHRLGSMRVVDEGPERHEIFSSCHNSVQGHHGVQRTVNEVRKLGYDWPRMSRDITAWVTECPHCQKIRGKSDVSAVSSPIGSLCIFEEISIDFQGPFPTDNVGNSYICGVICNTSRYCELFAVEAATAIIAAYSLLSVVARYGCFRSVRSDRGTHFVNEIIVEFLRLFDIQSVLTLAYRPQANAIVERNGGKVVRHLRAILLDKVSRGLWSVSLPLDMHINNRSYKQSIGTTPHKLIHWAPTDLDRGILPRFVKLNTLPAANSAHVRALEVQYERLFVCHFRTYSYRAGEDESELSGSYPD